MNEETFWKIIRKACHKQSKKCGQIPRPIDDWDERLVEALEKLEPDDIIEWNHIFDRFAARAYTRDLWGAAYWINGGASDDGFYYFRCWLIGMGKEVYEKALENPDTLANVIDTDDNSEAEIYAAAHQAWMLATGNDDEAPYPARNEVAELQGEKWNFDDEEEVRRRFPRLAKMFIDGEYN